MIKTVKYIIISIALLGLTNCGLLLNHKKPDFYTSNSLFMNADRYLIEQGYTKYESKQLDGYYYYNPLVNKNGKSEDPRYAVRHYKSYLIDNGYMEKNVLTKTYYYLDFPIKITSYAVSFALTIVALPLFAFDYIKLPTVPRFIYGYLIFAPPALIADEKNYYVVKKPYKNPNVLFEAIDNNETAYNSYLAIKKTKKEDMEETLRKKFLKEQQEQQLLRKEKEKDIAKKYTLNSAIKSYKEIMKEKEFQTTNIILHSFALEEDLLNISTNKNQEIFNNISKESIKGMKEQGKERFNKFLYSPEYKEKNKITSNLNKNEVISMETYFLTNTFALTVFKNLPDGIIAKEVSNNNLIYIEGAEKGEIGSPIQGTLIRYNGTGSYEDNGLSQIIYKFVDMGEYVDVLRDDFISTFLGIKSMKILRKEDKEFYERIAFPPIEVEIDGYKYDVPFIDYDLYKTSTRR